jgi:hypothetical protein
MCSRVTAFFAEPSTSTGGSTRIRGCIPQYRQYGLLPIAFAAPHASQSLSMPRP